MLMELLREMEKARDHKKARILQGFFKTEKGQYGEGDIFLGITVPKSREIAKKYSGLNLPTIEKLMKSKIHEHRLVSLLILVEKFKNADDKGKGDIFNFYIKNSKRVNNWDLVDLTAPKIVGEFLQNKDKEIIYEFAKSKNLWQKRISIVSTYTFIKNKQFQDAFRISEIHLQDEHDLMHKAVGWMLREIGKLDENALLDFLKKHYEEIPRTTLRYSIERFPESKRKKMLKGEFF